jgi:hypothetical protein
MMPTGHYNYVIGDSSNTRGTKKSPSSLSLGFFLIETIHAGMMKRHTGNHYCEFEYNKLIPPPSSCRLLFKLEWIFFLSDPSFICLPVWGYLLKIINILIVYPQLDTKQKAGVEQNWMMFIKWVLDRLHKESSIIQLNKTCGVIAFIHIEMKIKKFEL